MIELNQEAFTRMTIIRVNDDLTSQALALPPDEAAQLRDLLNATDLEGIGDPAANREALRLRQLTIYNGHNLPAVTDRRKFEAENNVNPRFDSLPFKWCW